MGIRTFTETKFASTLQRSLMFFSSHVTPNTSFLHLSLLSQFPKNKPSVNIIEAWQPAIWKTDSISHSHFLPLSLDDWGGEIMLEQFGRRPSDCHLMAYTSFLVCVLQNIWPVRKNHEKKKQQLKPEQTIEMEKHQWDGCCRWSCTGLVNHLGWSNFSHTPLHLRTPSSGTASSSLEMLQDFGVSLFCLTVTTSWQYQRELRHQSLSLLSKQEGRKDHHRHE